MNRLALTLAAALIATSLPAQVPTTLGYQARLTTSNGAPVNGAQTITFALYDVATGGTALWTETQAVTLSNGELSVSLGESTAIPENIFGRRLYLGIQVGSDPEMTPRPKFNAAPYSVKAKGTLQNTIYVPASGTPVENGNALKAAAASLPANSAIVLDGGEYDLGADNISMTNRTTLRGQGRLTSWVYSTNADFTVRLNGFQAQLKNMRVSNFTPTAVGANTATVLVADGANGAQIQDASIESSIMGTSAPEGARYAIMVRDADSVRVFNSSVFAGNAGQEVVAIASASPATASTGLNIDTVTINVNGNGIFATALSISDHTNVLLRDVRAFTLGTAANSTGLRANKGAVRIENSLLQTSGGGASTVHRAVEQIDSTLDVRHSNLAVFSVAGAAAYGLDGQFTPPATRRDLFFANSQLQNFSASVPQMTGMRLGGIRLVSTNSSIEVVSSGGTPTSVVGLLILPDASGAASPFLPLRSSQIEARHALSSDLGAAIVTDKTSINLEHSRVFASDDGIEAGQSGNAANVDGIVGVYSSIVSAGGATTGQRFSIRKHQNWVVISRLTDYKEVFLVESGGSLNCVATTRSGGGDSFIPTGCPLP